jgi:general secretion pathway protein D
VIGGTNFGNSSQNIISAASNLTNLGNGLNIGVIKGSITIPGVGSVTNIGVLARALETTANATILSRPNIQTLDNEEGKFLVGQNVPFVSGSYAATGAVTTSTGTSVTPFQTFERQDVGLQLRVKPQISEGGSVRLAIYIEDSSVSPGTSGTDLVLNKRSFETSVIVEDGNFVVISGMIQDQVNESQFKVPLLGNIPLLGALFRYDTREHVKTQTMVFLRPTVIRDEQASRSVMLDRYDYIRNELEKAAPPFNPVLPDMPTSWLAPLSSKEAPAPTTVGKADRQGADAPLIEVAVVDTMAHARQMQRQLRDAGLDAYWESVATSAGQSIRVRVTVQTPRRTLDDTLAQLRALGFSPSLVATERTSTP